jgi:uncharacterized membrane protein (DUF485 family)
MAQVTQAPPRAAAMGTDGVTGGSEHHPKIDWERVERSSEFKALVRSRRRFVVPALAFVFVWYFGFIALAGYAPDFMGESVYEGFTVGYAIALSQFVMTWVLGWLYLRQADRVFDPLAQKVIDQAHADAAAGAPKQERHRTRRFDRSTLDEGARRDEPSREEVPR